ncbi:MAG TPA: hypothetical protein VJB10_04075, partial [Candidatus Peribacteraceae bacterium]|nr:hypothetical protein [Candidatus Peribacteraceae bacterium]
MIVDPQDIGQKSARVPPGIIEGIVDQRVVAKDSVNGIEQVSTRSPVVEVVAGVAGEVVVAG